MSGMILNTRPAEVFEYTYLYRPPHVWCGQTLTVCLAVSGNLGAHKFVAKVPIVWKLNY